MSSNSPSPPPEKLAVYELVWKNIAETDGPEMSISGDVE
jgi:hypothetical protein